MTERIFTTAERKKFEEQAHRRGFQTLRDYVQTLIQQDAERHGEADDELLDPVEGFKQGWADAMEGRMMSHEEFVRRMTEDAD